MSSCVQCQHRWLLAEQITERALKLQMEEWKGLSLTCPPLVCWRQQDPVFAVAAPLIRAWGRLCLVLSRSLAALLHPPSCWVGSGFLYLPKPCICSQLFWGTCCWPGMLHTCQHLFRLSLFLPFAEVQYLSCSFPEPGPHSACLLSSKSFPRGKHQDEIFISFFSFDLDTFSALTKGKSLAESLTRCINCTEDAQRKSSQNLSECCRKAYFLVNLFLEVTELFWLKFPV